MTALKKNILRHFFSRLGFEMLKEFWKREKSVDLKKQSNKAIRGERKKKKLSDQVRDRWRRPPAAINSFDINAFKLPSNATAAEAANSFLRKTNERL
jgi:hypothetical protein